MFDHEYLSQYEGAILTIATVGGASFTGVLSLLRDGRVTLSPDDDGWHDIRIDLIVAVSYEGEGGGQS